MSFGTVSDQVTQDNELNTKEIICYHQDGLDEVFVKLDLSTKYKVINRLNHLIEAVFDKSLSEEQKIVLLKENNEMISDLNNLPIIEDRTTSLVGRSTNVLFDYQTDYDQGDQDEFPFGRSRF